MATSSGSSNLVTGAASVSVALGAIAANSTITAMVLATDAGATYTCADDVNGSIYSTVSGPDDSGSNRSYLFVGQGANVAGGSTTVTMTRSTGTGTLIGLVIVSSGRHQTDAVEAFDLTLDLTSDTAAAIGSVTTAADGADLIDLMALAANVTGTPSSGWTEIQDVSNRYLQKLDNVSAGAQSPSDVTLSGNSTQRNYLVALRTGRTTKNTRSWPLGVEIGMGWRLPV